jgi:hypothetical protein
VRVTGAVALDVVPLEDEVGLELPHPPIANNVAAATIRKGMRDIGGS